MGDLFNDRLNITTAVLIWALLGVNYRLLGGLSETPISGFRLMFNMGLICAICGLSVIAAIMSKDGIEALKSLWNEKTSPIVGVGMVALCLMMLLYQSLLNFGVSLIYALLLPVALPIIIYNRLRQTSGK